MEQQVKTDDLLTPRYELDRRHNRRRRLVLDEAISCDDDNHSRVERAGIATFANTIMQADA